MTHELKRLCVVSSVRVMSVSMAVAFTFIVQQSLELSLLSLLSLLQHISRSLRPPKSLAHTTLKRPPVCHTRLWPKHLCVDARRSRIYFTTPFPTE